MFEACAAFSPLADCHVALFLLVAALFTALPAAGARTLVIQHFDEQVTVSADGTIEVTEIIDAKFTGSWNGIYRTIPIEYTTPQGSELHAFSRAAQHHGRRRPRAEVRTEPPGALHEIQNLRAGRE